MFFWRALRIEATNCTLPPCAGPLQNIFCQGSLLEMAWLHGGERFLTLELKYSALEILHRFEQFLTQNPGGQTNEIFNVFLNENFVNDSSLEVCYPPDYQEFPNSLEAIIDIEYRNFARALNDRWKKLCRRTRPVLQDRSSLIPVPHPFIVPGGSFQEYYYWDTYWIVKILINLAIIMFESTDPLHITD